MIQPEVTEAIDASKNEILSAINAFSTQMDKRLATLVTKEEAKQFVTKTELHEELQKMESRMETKMVSKSYLDDKLADLISDQNKLMRQEDNKLKTLLGILHQNHTISNFNLRSVAALEPFPEHW